jgi:hypothetical protein
MGTNTGFIDGSISKPNTEFQKYVQKNSGPYVGHVLNNRDPSRMGRLTVNIPSITGSELGTQSQEIVCRYMTPFWGTKTNRYLNRDNANEYEGSQHSYGMWMVPPDIGTKVMVIFVEGDANQAYWMGCIPEPYVNHMTPGIGASTNTGATTSGGDLDQTKQQIYGTDNLPAGEVNRRILSESSGSIKQPIHPFAETLRQEGLIQDTVRGTTTSSARRESPSQVYGISTPGRKNPRSKSLPLGGTDSNFKDIVDRLTGQSFVMDDGDANGDNQLVRLRSASGHQILLNDSAGVVYIANGTGNAWMEFSSNGSIDVYAGVGGVNIRSAGDMNFHSDAGINMFAKKDIKISSESDIIVDTLNGSIQQYAYKDIKTQTVSGSISSKAVGGQIVSYAASGQTHHTSGRHDLTGSQVHFNSVSIDPNIVATYQPTVRRYVPDVDPKFKKSQLLTINPQGNITTVARMPTHEPFYNHYDKENKLKGFRPSTNDRIPGTAEYIAHQNRQSPINSVQAAQYQADLEYEITSQGATTSSKIRSIAESFSKNYNTSYKIPADIGINPTSTAVKDIVNQTIQNITNPSTMVGNLSQNILGTATQVTDTYKNIVGGKVTSVTQTVSLVSTVGKTISSTVKNIGKIFGW